ncbi:hypothetical protein ACFY3G_17890 [Streptomyces phaeochromogenes]|uniref:hypothetical protein n=1 Tax=Streptomyces phaeochromogenes TaxID=1923 RepID=UPI0036BC1341
MRFPVERAEGYYLPPPDQPPDVWALVPPAERVFRWVELRQHRRLTPPDGFVIGHPAYARINHNRWISDCPCGSAQVVTPADPRFACTECGYGWLRLVFPEDPAAVEASLAEQLPHLRNWWHPSDPDPWGVPPSDAPDAPAGVPVPEPVREVTR